MIIVKLLLIHALTVRLTKAFSPVIPGKIFSVVHRHHYGYHGPHPGIFLHDLCKDDSPRISDDILQELDTKHFVAIPKFISEDMVSALRNDVTNLRSLKKFNTAKIGQDSTNSLNENIRVAETCFLGKTKLSDSPNETREILYNVIDSIRQDLSRNLPLDQKESNGEKVKTTAPTLDSNLSELLYAYYPNGGFYRRHVDAIPNSASILRSYSLLLYLNKDWKESDGGSLRIYLDSGGDFLPEGEKENYIDVEPKGGTLVLFKSAEIPHEVLNTQSERIAVVGWYNRPFSSSDLGSIASEEDKVRVMMLTAAVGLVSAGVISLLL